MKATINHKRTNKKNGNKYALVLGDNNNALVYYFGENYKNGGMIRKWYICGTKGKSPNEIKNMMDNGMHISDAISLFNKLANVNFSYQLS